MAAQAGLSKVVATDGEFSVVIGDLCACVKGFVCMCVKGGVCVNVCV